MGEEPSQRRPIGARTAGEHPLEQAFDVPTHPTCDPADRRQVLRADHPIVAGPDPLVELRADHLDQRQDAVLALERQPQHSAGDRLGYALGVAESVLLGRDLRGVGDRLVATSAARIASTRSASSKSVSRYSRTPPRLRTAAAEAVDQAAVELGPQRRR